MTIPEPATSHAPARLDVLPALDGLRGLAAGLVVLTHAAFLTGYGVGGGVPGHLLARGDFGVAIFFALSGFLLHRGLTAHALRGGIDTFGYAVRRLARIAPAYWVTLVVVVVATHPPLRITVFTTLGLQVYIGDTPLKSFGQSWSIATEASFYLVLPGVVLLLAAVRRRRPAAALTLLAGALVVTSLLALVTGPAEFGEDLLVERLLPWRAPHFLVGMVLAEALTVPQHAVSRWLSRRGSDTVGCLLVAGAAYLASTTPVAGSLALEPAHGITLFMRTGLATVVAAGLLMPLVAHEHSAYSRAMSLPPLRQLGTVSYGLFLWHLPVFTALYSATGVPFFSGALAPLLAIGVPVSLLLAFLSHTYVEVPASRLASRYAAHRRQRRETEAREKGEAQRSLEDRRTD